MHVVRLLLITAIAVLFFALTFLNTYGITYWEKGPTDNVESVMSNGCRFGWPFAYTSRASQEPHWVFLRSPFPFRSFRPMYVFLDLIISTALLAIVAAYGFSYVNHRNDRCTIHFSILNLLYLNVSIASSLIVHQAFLSQIHYAPIAGQWPVLCALAIVAVGTVVAFQFVCLNAARMLATLIRGGWNF